MTMVPLTFSPEPPFLGPGAGTAAAQAAIPRRYAQPDGGWDYTVPPPPNAPSPAIWADANRPTQWQWTFYSDDPTTMWDFGDGGPGAGPSDFSIHNFPAFDAIYTVTATTAGGTASLLCNLDSSAAMPVGVAVVPTAVLSTAGIVPVTVEANNMDPGAYVCVAGVYYPTTKVDGTHFRIDFDTADGPVVSNITTVYVRNPDGSQTSGLPLTFSDLAP
jgi:hypothetical protein